jgi:hypothetical protein
MGGTQDFLGCGTILCNILKADTRQYAFGQTQEFIPHERYDKVKGEEKTI